LVDADIEQVASVVMGCQFSGTGDSISVGGGDCQWMTVAVF